ncbi:DUF6274 family protein [Streptomyces californicus]|uniref:DUF6274 family protein n=1 Tax=Streptomyces californicus TaxID=67351 RepID=UPI00369AF96C
MSASTARHEIRALLRAHLAAASAYRHLTRYCVVCHRLLRLAMEPGGDGAAGPATGRSTPPGTPPPPPAGRSAPPAKPSTPPARPSTPSVGLSPPPVGSPRPPARPSAPPARPSAASVALAAPAAARPSAASGVASEALRRPDGGAGSPGGAEDEARAPGPKRTGRPGKRSAEERFGAERPSPT